MFRISTTNNQEISRGGATGNSSTLSTDMKLSDYQLIIINSSAGKDSLCAIYEICRMADEQGFDRSLIHVSHQDLGEAEWSGTGELAKKQAELFGLSFHVTRRRNAAGVEETLLEYAKRRGKWASNKQRWCTSDFKRAAGARVVTALCKDVRGKVLHVFGFRADESPARKAKEVLVLNDKLSNSKRAVYDYLPIHDWNTARVWATIKGNNLPYHYAYDLGMPRLSCVFCIFSPADGLALAGIHNPELLAKYVKVEEEIGHTFRQDLSLASIKAKIDAGYKPAKISDWRM